MPALIKNPKQAVLEFQKVMREAGKLYGKKPSEITTNEFTFASAGRIGLGKLAQLGGFTRLRQYYFPSDKVPVARATKDLIERILNVKA